MIAAGHHGIVERRSAARLNPLQGSAQQAHIPRVILIQNKIAIEINHEYLVLRIAGSHQVQRRRVHAWALQTHRARVIDHDPQRHRNILPAERIDAL